MSDQDFARLRRAIFRALADGNPATRLLNRAARELTPPQWNALAAEIDTWFARQGMREVTP